MPIVSSQKETFEDPLVPMYYGDLVVPETEWGTVAGVGTPEDDANVTGDHIFRQTTQPTTEQGAEEGDVWFDTADDNHPKQLVDNVWTSVRDAGAGADTPGTGKWSHNLVFAVTDYNTINWVTGTITLPDGTAYSIGNGNTGDMAAITYIYLDTAISTTLFQTTTTAATAVGANKILVAVAKPNADTTKDAEFQVFGGFGQNTLITADNIAAGTITGDEIAANTITAGKISVSQLSAIAADLGTITAGTVTGATIQTASSGTRFVMTSTSFQGIESTGDVIFEVILSGGNAGDVIMGDDATGEYAQWDNSAGTFSVNGTRLARQDIFGDGSDGAVTISGNTTLTRDMFYTTLVVDNGFTLNTGGFRIFCSVSLTNNGTISRNGNNGVAGGTGTGGAGGAALADGSVKGSAAGTDGAGTRNGSSSGGTSAAKSLGVAGSQGGTGNNTTGADPSAGSAGTLTGTVFNVPRNVMSAYLLYDSLPTPDNLRSSAGSSGGAAGDYTGAGNFGGGGGAGSAGGIVAIYAKVITNNGTISSNGGNGANGGNGSSTAGNNGGGGGGGAGGSGGVVLLVYSTKPAAGTLSVTGGTAGSGGLGSNNGALEPSFDGGVGTAGLTGKTYELVV